MNIALRSLLCWSVTAGWLHAGFVVVQKVDGAMQSGTMTIKIDQGRARVDVSPEVSTITNTATGESITLMHTQKSFMKVPAERAQALAERMQKLQAQAGAASGPGKFTATGKKEKVEKYDCEIFTWNGNGMTAQWWVAKDYPNAAPLKAALDEMQNSGVAALAKGMRPDTSQLPGMVVKSEFTFAGQKITTTLVSAAEQSIEASVFEVPADYKELPLPDFTAPDAPESK